MAWQSDKLKEAHKELVDKVIKDMEEGKVFFWDSQHFGRPPRNIQSKKVNGKETRYSRINGYDERLHGQPLGYL